MFEIVKIYYNILFEIDRKMYTFIVTPVSNDGDRLKL